MTTINISSARQTPAILFAGPILGISSVLHLLLAGCATEGKEPATGIEWSSNLSMGDAQPSSLEGWTRALSAPWTMSGQPIRFPVSNGASQMVVSDCMDAFNAAEQNMRAQEPSQGMLEGRIAKCHAIRTMLNGINPKQSLINDFLLTEETVGELPVEMAVVLSKDDATKVALIKSAGGSLGDYLQNVTIRSAGNGEGVVIKDEQTGDIQFLSVLASGDFDKDGFGDLLIYSASTIKGGARAASVANLYLISRTEPNGPLVLRRKIV